MNCDNCQNPLTVTVTAVLNGKFGHYCPTCFSGNYRSADAGTASYNRQRDFEAHEADALQPWHKNGAPNTDFIRRYPDSAKEMYSKEELENYG